VSVGTIAVTSSRSVSPKQVGIAGVVLGALAWVITIPPIEVRGMMPSIVLAILAAAAGAWSVAGGERKLGIQAILVALLAVAGAVASAKSGVGTLESVFTWSALAAATLRYATPLLFAALGGVISESGGVINIGLEGMMLMGCFWGIYGADLLHSGVMGVLVAMLSGGLLALLHAFFSIHLRGNRLSAASGSTSWRSGSPVTSSSTTTARTARRSTSR
jgi:general nucleoside transport system permease protein